MDRVEAENERNAESGLFGGDFLQCVARSRVIGAEAQDVRADCAGLYRLDIGIGIGHARAKHALAELPDLFGLRHSGEQVFGSLFDRFRWIPVDWNVVSFQQGRRQGRDENTPALHMDPIAHDRAGLTQNPPSPSSSCYGH